MKWRNRITGLVTFTDRGLEYPWELVDEHVVVIKPNLETGRVTSESGGIDFGPIPGFEPESPYDESFDEEE